MQGEICNKKANGLKEIVRMLLDKEDLASLHKLELIDTIQRLGVSYHFEDEIKRILEAIHNADEKLSSEDLNATSLKFRLLRQHNFSIPQGNCLLDLSLRVVIYTHENNTPSVPTISLHFTF